MSVEAVSLEQVRRVAELANLELTPEEEPRMQRDLNAILEHIAQLNELDTKDVQAMAQVGEMLGEMVGEMLGAAEAHEKTGAALRQDAVRPSRRASRRLGPWPERLWCPAH
jgi:aspartyl-tRNA(Asn)/glutamyl-tRNA(Gln) amidotransferase subunit C